MFIVAVLQNIKVGDLSIHQSGQPLTEDFAENMVVDEDNTQLPGGTEAGMPALSRSDERAIVRESTAAFAGVYIITVICYYLIFPQTGSLLSSGVSWRFMKIYLRKVVRETPLAVKQRKEFSSH